MLERSETRRYREVEIEIKSKGMIKDLQSDQDVEIIVAEGSVKEVVGEAVKVAGGPLKGDGAGEHGPEGEEDDGGEGPELVSTLTEEGGLGGASGGGGLRRRR